MNSDPHESAAWRTFGMLDSDEAAAFDDAMQRDPQLRSAYREIDRLTAAIAVSTTLPVPPRAGQLERLHLRLGLDPLRQPNWLGISGWAAAAALVGLLVAQHLSSPVTTGTAQNPGVMKTDGSEMARESPEVATTADDPGNREPAANIRFPQVTEPASEGKSYVRVETKRLIQEIEVLRGQLESLQMRDRQRFEATPGVAWPIVMRMVPPAQSRELETGSVAANEEPPITVMLADALAAAGPSLANPEQPVTRAGEFSPSTADYSAVPIYDAARDTGTLVVNHLPEKAADERFNLWVVTGEGANPIYVGRLPESGKQGSDSFDFSLGSNAIVPSGFLLTKDNEREPVLPSRANTILKGPK